MWMEERSHLTQGHIPLTEGPPRRMWGVDLLRPVGLGGLNPAPLEAFAIIPSRPTAVAPISQVYASPFPRHAIGVLILSAVAMDRLMTMRAKQPERRFPWLLKGAAPMAALTIEIVTEEPTAPKHSDCVKRLGSVSNARMFVEGWLILSAVAMVKPTAMPVLPPL